MNDTNVNIDSKCSCDVLIVGGGSGRLRAAIEAHDAGAHVLDKLDVHVKAEHHREFE